MTDDPITTFILRFDGGPLDGETRQSPFTDRALLPLLVEVDPGGEQYELASASELPPTPGIWRGALYRHVAQ